MKKRLFSFLCGFFTCLFIAPLAHGQDGTTTLKRPKLVVGIVVDQMRYDYLYRFYDKYGEGGFKRMMREGFNCRNHHYPYGYTATGPGHASVYTGSVPAIHGIIGNEWFDPIQGKNLNCVADNTVSAVGTTAPNAGKASPANLLVSTVTDQLRIATNFKSKTISIGMKDRSAILPGGHSANGAYWFNDDTGNWITSTFYMKELPQWVKDFNARKLAVQYVKQGWKTLLPIEAYTESTADDQPYEDAVGKNKKPEFPYDLGTSPGATRSSPWGNTLTKEMAIAAIKGENLGKGTVTDFLAMSFSTPDAIGHRYGPNSIEQQDIYLRLDRELADLFQFLDSWVGKGSYTVFLTADHGVMDAPEFLQNHRIPGYRLKADTVYTLIRKRVEAEFGKGDYFRSLGMHIHLNKPLLKERGITIERMCEVIREAILPVDGIADVLDTRRLAETTMNDYLRRLYINQTHAKRSGDLIIALQPNWITRARYGTTHGSPYNYDTHVPFVLFGWGIAQGETLQRTEISDIAPTIAALLHILPPSGSIGNPIEKALE